MGEDGARETDRLLERLLEVADRSGVSQVWLSTVRMSRDLGMTQDAITDTILAIVHAGARVPSELQDLVDQVRSRRAGIGPAGSAAGVDDV